jgi:hypothetical protein
MIPKTRLPAMIAQGAHRQASPGRLPIGSWGKCLLYQSIFLVPETRIVSFSRGSRPLGADSSILRLGKAPAALQEAFLRTFRRFPALIQGRLLSPGSLAWPAVGWRGSSF